MQMERLTEMLLGKIKKCSILIPFTLSLVSCSQNKKCFNEAHDSFKTKLITKYRDDDPIPDPPEGVFDLVRYPSKVGDLAAYVSSDPDDGQKHPLIILFWLPLHIFWLKKYSMIPEIQQIFQLPLMN